MKSFIRISRNVIQDMLVNSYSYIDTKDHVIDQILIDSRIRVSFDKNEFAKEGSPFVVCTLKCSKRMASKIEKVVFPKLQEKLLFEFGDSYKTFNNKLCEALAPYLGEESAA